MTTPTTPNAPKAAAPAVAEAELLQCPFCGSKPELHVDKMLGDAWLGCMNKECTVAPYIEAPDLDERGGEASATEAWNRRASPPPLAAAPQQVAAWMPVQTASEGVRVLLGPRDAPVVGKVSHPAEWQEGETSCHLVHYNGNVLVAGYHCKEWHPLPAYPAPPSQASATGEV